MPNNSEEAKKLKATFAKNLNMLIGDTPQIDIANAIGVIPATFSSWCTGKSIPRMDKIEKLALYFGVNKSDLIEDRSVIKKEQQKLTDDDLKFALFGGEKGITDAQLAEIRNYVEFVKKRDGIEQSYLRDTARFKLYTKTKEGKASVTTAQAYELAEKNGYIVDSMTFPESKSFCTRIGTRGYIGIDKNIKGREEKERLCHEIGHLIYAGTYSEKSAFETISRIEHRANKWTYIKLIPVGELREALNDPFCRTVPEVADKFGVTEDFARDAITYYAECAGLL